MTDSTDNALKPCPFCGGSASFKPRSFKASCDRCGAHVSTGATTRDEAIAAWNHRAARAHDPLAHPKVKALVEDLRSMESGWRQCGCNDAGCYGRHEERNMVLDHIADLLATFDKGGKDGHD